MALTLLGIYWIGFALAHRGAAARAAARPRDRDRRARRARSSATPAPTSAGACSAADRWRRSISPGKTVEGLVIGMVCAVLGVWIAGRYQDLAAGHARARARPRRRARRAAGRPVRVVLKREAGVKDSGTLFGAHGGALDRLDAALFTIVVGYYIWSGVCLRRKRLLILGSTGSIGTQALEVCAASEELELVGLSAERSWEALVEQARAHGVARVALADEQAAASARGRGWRERCSAAPRGSCGWSSSRAPTSCSTRSWARRGSARPWPTLGEGIDLALANKESLVVGGELVTALAEATGAQIVPGRLRAHGAAPADRRAAARLDRAADDHRQRRAVSRPPARAAARRDRRARRSRTRRGRWGERSRSTRPR